MKYAIVGSILTWLIGAILSCPFIPFPNGVHALGFGLLALSVVISIVGACVLIIQEWE